MAEAAQPRPKKTSTTRKRTASEAAPEQPSAPESPAAPATRSTKAAGGTSASTATVGETPAAGPRSATKAAKSAPGEAAAKPSAKRRRAPNASAGAGQAKAARATRKSSASGAAGTNPRASARATARPQVLPPKPRLPRAGKTVHDGLGVPVFGARHGSVERVDWSALAKEHRRHPLLSRLRHRRWIYATASTDRLLVALAVVDAGPAGTAFCMVTDLETGETLVDSSRPGGLRPLVRVGDHPLQDLSASYRLPGTDYRFEAKSGSEIRFKATLRSTAESLPGLRWIPGLRNMPVIRNLPTASSKPWVDIDLTLEPTVAPALTAISPVDAEGGMVTSTVKTAAMNAWGTVTIHGDDPAEAPLTLSLDGGTGGMDYTNGFLPRHTAWRWVYSTGRLGDGRLFGVNLVSGFSGIGDDAVENAVWLDGALVPITSPVRVLGDRRDLSKPWTVRTLDGSIHLQFEPLAVHDERLNLGVIRSLFIQPTGRYSGHIEVEGERIVLDGMPGLIEDQDILW